MTGRAEPYRTATCKTLASKTKRVTQPSEYPSVRYWSKEINASGTSTCRPPRCRRRRPGPAGSITRRPGMTRVGPGPGPDRTIVTATHNSGLETRNWANRWPSDWAGQTGQSGWPVVAAPCHWQCTSTCAAIEKL